MSTLRSSMSRTSRFAVALVLAGCGTSTNADDMSGDGSGIGGLPMTGTSSGSDAATEDDTSSPPVGGDASSADDGSGGGLKFDIPAPPDAGDANCGVGEGGDGSGTFSNIWVANAPQGTVSKIDTGTATEVARYRTTPTAADQPSRTSVNQFGDIAAGHRYAARVVKIAAEQEDCVDANANGVIDTSTGATDILDWSTDECVVWEADLLPAAGQGTRAVAWEGGTFDPATCENTNPNPRLWVAYGQNPMQVKRLDGATGAVLDELTIPSTGFVYGGAVNGDGDFWVSDRSGGTMSRVD
ncbi:MAG: hypothetical protein AB1Z98_25475, partial [Nannocystaceae bacterium]